jgi:hypothetical protein
MGVWNEARERPVKFTQEQAERHAECIRAYWRDRGYEIEVWIEPISQTYSKDFAVRSSLRFRARRPSGREGES